MYYRVWLENQFNYQEKDVYYHTDDIEELLCCNSDLLFHRVMDIEPITEREYYEATEYNSCMLSFDGYHVADYVEMCVRR